MKIYISSTPDLQREESLPENSKLDETPMKMSDEFE
jgi:hypothetical protein